MPPSFGIRSQSRTLRKKKSSTKTDTSRVYLYVCHLGGDNWKVGATCDPNRRCNQIRTCAPAAKMTSLVKIPMGKGAEWSKLETKVLRKYADKRSSPTGGREVFTMTAGEAKQCVGFMRKVCA